MAVSIRVASLVLLAGLFLAHCGTSSGPGPSTIDVQIEQLPDVGFAVEERGAVSIAYQMTLRNPSADEITLRKVEMHTDSRSRYALRRGPVDVNETIPPGAEAVVTFTMWSTPREAPSARNKVIRVTGTLHFDGPNGSFERRFATSFREP